MKISTREKFEGQGDWGEVKLKLRKVNSREIRKTMKVKERIIENIKSGNERDVGRAFSEGKKRKTKENRLWVKEKKEMRE